ncbi:MAG: biotin--[acetyl-CoA-carboxylase] ligase [Alphaproteobacteria bacterium]|nr:MAG: biotin--[acetyl-CoA-carboxylase] ligase [Alphaproteobacteria bacterium]
MALDWLIQTYDQLPSTQGYLKEAIADNPDLAEGTVIHALHQKSGYGRHGRVWQSDLDNLTFSILIKPNCAIEHIGQIAILSGLAISKAIDDVIAPEHSCILKWPNDILINDRKCCGILIDAAPIKDNKVPYFIIGIGINIASAPLETATFLQGYTDVTIESNKFMKDVLSSFSTLYTQWQKDGFKDIRTQWLGKTYNVGCDIGVKIDKDHIQGKFDTIDMLGNLIITCGKNDEKRKITSGEVFLL